MLKRFRLEEPQSVAEVSQLLGRFGDRAKIYAGGTELLLAMKEGLVDYETLVDIKKLAGLDEIEEQGGAIKIGALCSHRHLESSPVLRARIPSLVKLEHHVANVRVREAGTIGGNICFAEPHADPGTLLMALNATMTAAKDSSTREIPAADFFVDAYETSLAPDELLTEIRIPTPTVDERSVYMKFGYLERPSVGVALAFRLKGGEVHDVRIAVGCAGPAPRRVQEAEAMLEGNGVDAALHRLPQAGTVAGRASQAISDLHGSQEYKEHIVAVLLKRAFQGAVS